MDIPGNIDNPELAQVMEEIRALYTRYGFSGAYCVVSAEEVAYGYPLQGPWNAITIAPNMPMGFRLQALEDEIGPERTKVLVQGTEWLFTALAHFGEHTASWGHAFLEVLRRSGIPLQDHPRPGTPKVYAFDLRNRNC